MFILCIYVSIVDTRPDAPVSASTCVDTPTTKPARHRGLNRRKIFPLSDIREKKQLRAQGPGTVVDAQRPCPPHLAPSPSAPPEPSGCVRTATHVRERVAENRTYAPGHGLPAGEQAGSERRDNWANAWTRTCARTRACGSLAAHTHASGRESSERESSNEFKNAVTQSLAEPPTDQVRQQL